MAEYERKKVGRQSRDTDAESVDVAPSADGQEMTDRIDEILDEIDTVLEENAEEFVKNYVQKGGE